MNNVSTRTRKPKCRIKINDAKIKVMFVDRANNNHPDLQSVEKNNQWHQNNIIIIIHIMSTLAPSYQMTVAQKHEELT